MRCCIKNCVNDDSKKTKSKGLTFHMLPKDPADSALWLEAITRLGYRMSKCLVVCSEHFLPDDFDDAQNNQRRVKSGAVPTIMAPVIQEELKVCRVCLALDVKMFDMKNYKLSEMFQNITGILATDNNDTILQRVCWECVARLKAAAAFRDKALLSDALLKDLTHIDKSEIVTLKQNHTSLKPRLTVHSILTLTDIEGVISIPENKAIDILTNDETDEKVRVSEEATETELEKNEPWIEIPMKTEAESDPLGDNDVPMPVLKSETFPEQTHFDDCLASGGEDIEDEIRDTKVQINNNKMILRENTQIEVPIINSEGNIVLANDEEIKPMLDDTIEEESSGVENSQSTAEVTVSKAREKKSSKIGASSEKGSNKKISNFLRTKIVVLYEQNVSLKGIARQLGIARQTVRLWVRRFQETGDVKTSPMGRRVTGIYTDQSERHRDIVKVHTTTPSASTRYISQRHGISMSTVRRHIHAAKNHIRPPANKICLEEQKRERVRFAENYINFDWENNVVIFSDEVTFRSDSDGRKILWRKPSGRYQPQNVLAKRASGGITLGYWGWMSSMGPGELVETSGRMNSQTYLKILQDVMVPTVRLAYPEGQIYFVLENCRVYRSRIVIEWLTTQSDIIVIFMPSKSPDLNPMENVWGQMVLNWDASEVKSKIDLHNEVLRRWELMRGSDVGWTMVAQMRSRLQKIIESDHQVSSHQVA